MSSSLVNVRVDGGTLWIGNAAYVLKNITSIEPVHVHGSERPKPRRFNWLTIPIGCVAAYLAYAILLILVFLLVKAWAIIILVAGGAGFYVYKKQGNVLVSRERMSRLRARLPRMPSVWIEPPPRRSWNYYEIRISTAGRQRRALTVEDWATAQELTRRIADAIANPDSPDTVFSMQVENLNVDTYHVGDNNTTYGPDSPAGTWYD